MEITAKLLKEFIAKRLEEEKSKDKNEYWCLNGKLGYGMHYWDHIEKALDPIFEDIDYAMKHPEVLTKEDKKSINDYDTVEDALNNLYKYHNNYVIEITLIINENITDIPIMPCDLDDDLANTIRNELKYKDLPYLEKIFSSSSYYMNFFEDYRSLTIIIH